MVPDPLPPDPDGTAPDSTDPDSTDPDSTGNHSAEAGSDTLARLAGQIEQLLAEEQVADAVQMARATVEMLQHVVSRAAESDPNLDDLSGQLGRIRHNLDTIDVAG